MHRLTEDQRMYAEENCSLIDDFLWYNGLKRSEYYDVVAFGFLGAVQVYHESSNARQYEFTTIASRKMCDSLFSYWRYNGRLKRKAYLVDLDGNLYEDQRLTLSEVIDTGGVRSEDLVFQRLLIDEAMAHMTDKEKIVVHLRAAGYSGPEIGLACGVTASSVYGRLYRMRKRLKLALAA